MCPIQAVRVDQEVAAQVELAAAVALAPEGLEPLGRQIQEAVAAVAARLVAQVAQAVPVS